MDKPIWGKWANNHAVAQLHVYTSPWNFKWGKSIQRFQRYAFRKVWTQLVTNLTSFWPMGKPIWGKWANDHDSAQLRAQTIPQNFERRKSAKRLQRYMGPASLTAAHPPARTVTIPLQPGGESIGYRWIPSLRKRWRATACCGKSKFAISSGWLKSGSVCHPDDIITLSQLIRMTYGGMICHPDDILQCPKVFRMRYCQKLTHPDDLGFKLRYVIRMR